MDINRLNRAIDGRIEVEFAFIEAMKLEFQRIQQSLNECIWRHPEDYQLALVGKDLQRAITQPKSTMKPRLGRFIRGGKHTKHTRKCRHPK